jgi:hypothetical protein
MWLPRLRVAWRLEREVAVIVVTGNTQKLTGKLDRASLPVKRR